MGARSLAGVADVVGRVDLLLHARQARRRLECASCGPVAAADADRAVVLPTVQNRQARPPRPNGSKGLADDRNSTLVVCVRDTRFPADSTRRLLHVGACRRLVLIDCTAMITDIADGRR